MYHIYVTLIIIFSLLIVGYKVLNISESFSTQEYVYETLKQKDKEMCKLVLDSVLSNINKKYDLSYAKGYIERAKITEKPNHTNLLLQVFLYETSSDVNKKVVIDVNLNKDNSVSINHIKNTGAFVEPIMDRLGESGRNSVLFKPELGVIKPNDSTNLEYSNVDLPETKNKMQNRTSWVLDKDAEKLTKEGAKMFPCRTNRHVWDKNGVSIVQKENKTCKGIYSGVSDKPIRPNFYPNLFTDNNDSYHWMFDRASDSASRPVGVTGARGSSL